MPQCHRIKVVSLLIIVKECWQYVSADMAALGDLQRCVLKEGRMTTTDGQLWDRAEEDNRSRLLLFSGTSRVGDALRSSRIQRRICSVRRE